MEPELFANMAQLEREHWWFLARNRLVHTVIEQLDLPADARILDVGAGTGGTTAALQRFGTVTALEVDPEARRFLSSHGFPVLTEPLPDPSVPSDSRDLVTAFDVLEHVPDDLAVASDIRRIVKPGGHFVATVPADPRLWTAHDDAHHHHRRYTISSLVQLFGRAGFVEVYCTPWLVPLYPLFVAQRLITKATGRAEPLSLPHPLVNRMLLKITSVERRGIERRRVARFGGSLLIVGRAPDS